MSERMFNNPVIQDREALEEFADVLSDRAPEVERDVARLKKSPGDRDLIATLFRSIHNIKGDAALCKFDLAVAIAHPIETLMSRYRNGELPFSDLLAESILLAIDRLELATDSLLRQRPVDNLHLITLIEGLDAIAQAPSGEIEPLSRKLIESVTGFSPVTAGASSKPAAPAERPERTSPASADLHFFRSLGLQFEGRSPLFRGRTMRILRLALETNRASGNPVDPLQLEAAVYMHDVGMMFLPESIWLKVGKLTQAEKLMLQDHPAFGAGILERMPGWHDAAEIVAQHHEMPDGGGYPGALRKEQICTGAKILAIVDAFEAVMLKHIHRGRNRSVLRAIAEVNACDNQFAPEWIAPFNTVIRRTIEN